MSSTCRAFLLPLSSAKIRTPSACRRRRYRPIKSALVDAHAPHHAHAGAPVFVDIEAIDFDVWGN
jgi:hypothetical protein